MNQRSANHPTRSLADRVGRMPKRGVTALLCLLGMMFAYPSFGQEFRAVLTGQVTDPSGALIHGAIVTAVENSSGTNYTDKTSDKGVYYIPYVLPGTYKVTVEADGFKMFVQDNVLLTASQTFAQNFKLEVGTISEKVEVTAAPPSWKQPAPPAAQ